MKSISTFFTLVLLFALTSSLFAQTDWTKYLDNPVLDPGPPGSWDAEIVGGPWVLFDDTTYHMWYIGGDETHWRIGYATSPDGITWTKYAGNPVLEVGTDFWESESVYGPALVINDSTYHMWYTGAPSNQTGSIGYATSTDGVTWTKYENNPVMGPGEAGTWEEDGIEVGSVLFDGEIFRMWYDGWDEPNSFHIGYATSSDGINWTRDENNPVLDVGTASSWDYPRVSYPNVMYDGANYHMWYSGGGWFRPKTGYATSPDGIAWTKYANNPVLDVGTAGSWDDRYAGVCYTIFDSSTGIYKMWYSGGAATTGGSIGYATAPAIINVPGNFETIQTAINAAHDGNVILVDEGTYYENINFKGKAITVASHFYMDGDTSHISKTIIDGSQPTNPDSGSVVYFISGEDTTSVLMGFTITNGTGTKTQYTYEGNKYDARGGGGIFCWNSGGRFVWNRIINNTISDDNDVIGGGVGAGDFGSNAWVILEDNDIMYNTINGGYIATGGGVVLICNGKIINNVISYNSCTAAEYDASGGGVKTTTETQWPRTVIIKGNHITHNFVKGKGTLDSDYWSAFGGGIQVYASKVFVLNNEISHNQLKDFGTGTGSGGGIYMWLVASGSIINGNTISNNKNEVTGTKFGGGIGLGQSDGLSITNNIITGNTGSHGAGIRLNYNNAEIINNTIVNNTASTSGGGLYSTNSNPVVINTILWENEAPSGSQIYGSGYVLYSDIQGGWSGEGNINKDPQFVDTLSYNLSELSPCVGSGIDSIQVGGTWYYSPATDISGRQRPDAVDSFVDMGAQESVFPNGIINEYSDYLPTSFSLKQNYPNPFNPTTMINYQLPMTNEVELSIYNLLGQKVVTLVSNKQKAGYHQVEWDASGFASGIYYYSIKAGEFKDVKKMILLR